MKVTRSWRTTLGGLITAAGIAMHKHPKTEPFAAFVEMFGAALLGLSARDQSSAATDHNGKSKLVVEK